MVSSGRKRSRLSFDHYHRCVSLEDTTVGFLSRAIASYAFDVTTCERRDGIFTEGWKKKQEREIHWRYGLVTARVERTTWQKKERERETSEREREEKRAISSRFFSAPFFYEPSNPGAGNGLDFLRLRTFYYRSGLSVISTFNGRRKGDRLPNIRA